MAELIKQIIRTQQIIEPQIRLIEQLQKNIIEINRIQKKFIPLVPIKYSGLLKEVVEGALEMNSPSFKSFRKDWGWLVNNKVFTFGDYC